MAPKLDTEDVPLLVKSSLKESGKTIEVKVTSASGEKVKEYLPLVDSRDTNERFLFLIDEFKTFVETYEIHDKNPALPWETLTRALRGRVLKKWLKISAPEKEGVKDKAAERSNRVSTRASSTEGQASKAESNAERMAKANIMRTPMYYKKIPTALSLFTRLDSFQIIYYSRN